MAGRQPDTMAIAVPAGKDRNGQRDYIRYTFKQLDDDSNRIAGGLEQIGIKRGVRTVVMVKPGIDYFSLVFALFKVGAVMVMVDPGMGIRNLKQCLCEAEPEAFIGITKAHIARTLFRWARGSIRIKVAVGCKFPGLHTSLKHIRKIGSKTGQYVTAIVEPDDTAAILFTSGSTGVPKGVVYTHKIFTTQVEILRKIYQIKPGEIDLPTFPLFALFDPALGMTTIIPEMDFSRPAKADPAKIIKAIKKFKVTNMFGSPAIINLLGRYGEEDDIKLPTLKRVISAGAPVPAASLERFTSMLNADVYIHTPYGATESLPVSTISSDEILNETRFMTDQGAGVCVGRPVEGIEVSIIEIIDDPVTKWSDDLMVPTGQIGEIVVRGPVVTKEYFNRKQSTEMAKIPLDTEEGFCHRMGDVGYLDDKGRLWFCGRKKHRVITEDDETLFTVPCEAIFNVHPNVFRTALTRVIRSDGIVPVLCVELEKGIMIRDKQRIVWELLDIAEKHSITKPIENILIHKGFPVDIRHNSKIFREKLGVWADKYIL